MAKEEYDSNISSNTNVKIKDLEEKQKILKDRILLIGENLISTREKNSEEITEMKKQVQELKQKLDRTNTFLENISKELSKFAHKDDLNILRKQAKMFQPFEDSKNENT